MSSAIPAHVSATTETDFQSFSAVVLKPLLQFISTECLASLPASSLEIADFVIRLLTENKELANQLCRGGKTSMRLEKPNPPSVSYSEYSESHLKCKTAVSNALKRRNDSFLQRVFDQLSRKEDAKSGLSVAALAQALIDADAPVAPDSDGLMYYNRHPNTNYLIVWIRMPDKANFILLAASHFPGCFDCFLLLLRTAATDSRSSRCFRYGKCNQALHTSLRSVAHSALEFGGSPVPGASSFQSQVSESPPYEFSSHLLRNPDEQLVNFQGRRHIRMRCLMLTILVAFLLLMILFSKLLNGDKDGSIDLSRYPDLCPYPALSKYSDGYISLDPIFCSVAASTVVIGSHVIQSVMLALLFQPNSTSMDILCSPHSV